MGDLGVFLWTTCMYLFLVFQWPHFEKWVFKKHRSRRINVALERDTTENRNNHIHAVSRKTAHTSHIFNILNNNNNNYYYYYYYIFIFSGFFKTYKHIFITFFGKNIYVRFRISKPMPQRIF
jgi:hypothetical protein